MALALIVLIAGRTTAQKLKPFAVPAAARSALSAKYPTATAITWEQEKGNYEANWGGRSKEDSSVLFTPAGQFIEEVIAIPVASLPPAISLYVRQHYPGVRIAEAGRLTDAAGNTRYEAEVKGKELLFDTAGNFLKID
jgi:hypothetical protein